MMLIEAAVLAPWCAVIADDVSLIHRVNMDGLPMATWDTADHATSVCGLAVKLINLPWSDLRTRNTKHRRCSVCNPPRRKATS